MLFHASIPADNPEHVARVIAKLWGGEALQFPPFPGAFIVLSGDDRGTVLDVYPRGQEHVPAQGEYAVTKNPTPRPHSEVHLAIGTVLSAEDAIELAAREGWLAQRSPRGGLFDVVEFWVENKFLLELLPEPEQRRYVANVTAARLRARFGISEQEE